MDLCCWVALYTQEGGYWPDWLVRELNDRSIRPMCAVCKRNPQVRKCADVWDRDQGFS